jgi:hypothetical protein
MIAFPGQFFLPMRVDIKRPLMGIEAVKGVLDCDEDAVMAYIADGTIEWAWDLRGATRSERQFVRVWAQSVDRARHILAGDKPSQFDLRDPEIVHALLKHSKPFVKSSELQRVWNCSGDHVNDLIRTGLLATVKAKTELACNEASSITRETLITFMSSRRIR